MKKFFASAIAVLFILSTLSPLSANASSMDNYYADDLDGHWAIDTMYQLIDADIMKGYMNAGVMSAKPNQNITRAEVTALIVRSLDLSTTKKGKTFTDVPERKWYYAPIQTASALGIVNGKSETTFEPEKNITREELATIIVRAFEYVESIDFSQGKPADFSDKSSFSQWAIPYINKASAVKLIQGFNGKFSPKATATRAETSTMLLNGLEKESTSLPTDEELMNIVLSNENEMYQHYQKSDFQSAYSVIDQYTLGFYHALMHNSNGQYIDAVKDGLQFEFKQVGTPSTEVLGKNTRLATVELSGLSYEVTMRYKGETYTETDDTTSGAYFLRKINGEWKIYSQVSYNY